MNAYFSSKFKKQIQVALSIALLAICLLGTRWIGLSHSISHSHIQSQTAECAIESDALPALNHSSDACHLFDALTLAGFISSNPAIAVAYSNYATQSNNFAQTLIAQAPIERYQSRAPPILLA